MRVLILIVLAVVGYNYFFGSSPAQIGTTGSLESWFAQGFSLAKDAYSTGAKALPSTTDLTNVIEPVRSQAANTINQATSRAGSTLSNIGNSDCGTPDPAGNLKYCFNK